MVAGILFFLAGSVVGAVTTVGALIALVIVLDWEHPYSYDK